jgi:small subunit ribosomal protein S1
VDSLPRRLDEEKADYLDGIVGRFSEAVGCLPKKTADFDRLFLAWVRHRSSFNPDVEIFPGNQHVELISTLRKLDANGAFAADAEPVERFYRWVLQWQGFSLGPAREKAGKPAAAVWDQLEASAGARQPVAGWILYPVKGGFAVDLGGAFAFLPGREVDTRPVDNMVPLLRSPQSFRIIKLDRTDYELIVSRRAVRWAERLGELQAGKIVDGVVKNITKHGIFVDLGVIDGLVKQGDQNPSEEPQVGQHWKVRVARIDLARELVWLRMTQTEEDPWREVEAKYPKGTRHRGRVDQIVDDGAFVALEAGVRGLVPRTEMSWTNPRPNPESIVTIGQEVEIIVLSVGTQEREIKLQLKETLWERWRKEHPAGSELDGVVRNIDERHGLFVRLPSGADGRVLQPDRPLAHYRKGERLRLKVIRIDRVRHRIDLGLAAAAPVG